VAAPLWFSHPASLAHDIPGHPERPQRLVALEAALDDNDWFGWGRETSPAATREQLERVHPAAYVDAIESLCAAGGGAIDGDTACVPETWEAAIRGAGGAVALTDALLSGAAPAGFAIHRPPGHHAEPARAMGFCFFGNVAVAAEHARAAHGVERVLIVDWDVHHGNGTEACFADRPDVLFASIHQSPLYPGTGPASYAGVGAGEGYTVNLPVPGGSGDATFTSLVEHVVVPVARAYEPGLILISAGFDAHALDPLASCQVSEDGFVAMTASLRRVAAELEVPVGAVLEGGYSVEALAQSVCALAPVLGGAEVPAAPEVAVDRLATAALERLRGFDWSV
jgi:acetoin utilization deacetylase AcuC-like enzyme